MKGIAFVLLSLLVTLTVSFAQTPTAEFGLATKSALDPGAAVLRMITQKISSPGQFVIDNQSEDRGSRPIVAFTLFSYETASTDISVQPLVGRINGAQLRVNW